RSWWPRPRTLRRAPVATLALVMSLTGCGAQARHVDAEPAVAMNAQREGGTLPPSERLIADFEHDSAATAWRVTDGDVRLEPSGDRPGRGERSLRITYGTAGFRIPRLDLERVGASDWQGWDTFEFDIYNAHPEPVSLRVGLFGGGVSTLHSHNVTVPPGEWHRYRMSARRFEGHGPGAVDRADIDGFTVMGHPNYLQEQEPVTIYLDNVRLTNRSDERIAALRGVLDGLDIAGRGSPGGADPLPGGRPSPEAWPTAGPALTGRPTDGDAATSSSTAIVRDVDGALRQLASASPTARGREADSRSLRVAALEQTLAEALQARMVEHLALTSRIAAPVPIVREPGVPAELLPLRGSTSSA